MNSGKRKRLVVSKSLTANRFLQRIGKVVFKCYNSFLVNISLHTYSDMPLNPQSAKNELNSFLEKTDQDKVHMYPQFFNMVKLEQFRHVSNLELRFVHPISIISGSNRSGKTSALMTIACSHYNFDRKDVANGTWRRATWSHLVRFTNHDIQTQDWTYYIEYREGNAQRSDRGYRKHISKKWGGAGKKEKQIGRPDEKHPEGGRHVCLIDLNRINPARHLTSSAYNKAKKADATTVANQRDINEYLSYILENGYVIDKLVEAADNNVYKFRSGGTHSYSSFNTASGEDVLVNLLGQILHMPDYSLILIDEIEVGLHPKIQRRLMDVIYIISQKQHKQFIITSHSYAVIDSVTEASRIFIQNNAGNFVAMTGLTTYETLTRMDSVAFPVAMIYVEDVISKQIVENAIAENNIINPGIGRLVKTVIVGPASETYKYFKTRQRLNSVETLFPKAACVLDGDMQHKKNKNGDLTYPPESNLFFHFSEEAPEKMLVTAYLARYPNTELQYHVENSNPHCLLNKIVELGLAVDQSQAFDCCFNLYKTSDNGSKHFQELKQFINSLIKTENKFV